MFTFFIWTFLCGAPPKMDNPTNFVTVPSDHRHAQTCSGTYKLNYGFHIKSHPSGYRSREMTEQKRESC